MAENGHGGARTPSSPAPVSPPGSLSRRTDGSAVQAGMVASGGGYGERKAMEDLQSGAPLAGSSPVPGLDLGALRAALPPIDAPTSRPSEPLTAGLGTVPSVGAAEMDDATRERLSNALPMLAWLASQPKASEQTRQFFRQVRSDL